jgi:hypothetical protein
MSISFFGGSLAPGHSARMTVLYHPTTKDQGPVYFTGKPLNPGGRIRSNAWAKVVIHGDPDDHIHYRATLTNTGTQATNFNVIGGRLKDDFRFYPTPQTSPTLVYTISGGFENRVTIRLRSPHDKGVVVLGATGLFKFPLAPFGVGPDGGTTEFGPIELVSQGQTKMLHTNGDYEWSATLWNDDRAAVAYWIEGGVLTNDPY